MQEASKVGFKKLCTHHIEPMKMMCTLFILLVLWQFVLWNLRFYFHYVMPIKTFCLEK